MARCVARTVAVGRTRGARGAGRALALLLVAAVGAGAEARRPSAGPANNYHLQHTSQKLVDNRGQGFEPLYGTRNFRYVLRGVVYRGGANNTLHRSQPRDNRNPLPDDGLRNLCADGFGTAVYLYPRNYSRAPAQVTCQRGDAPAGSLAYRQLSAMNRQHMRKILETVHAAITRRAAAGPVYLHCWNGWHASGLAAALTLRQFCEVDADTAVRYWDRNTDGYNREQRHAELRQQIRDFTPYRDLAVAAERRREICPSVAQLLEGGR